jgi:hypothetical protein
MAGYVERDTSGAYKFFGGELIVKAVSLKTDKEIRGLVIRFWTRSFFGMQT